MPNTQSAKKALRQNAKRRTVNANRKAETARAIKNYKKLVSSEKKEEAKKALNLVYKKLDKLAKTNVISKNKASRLKSRMAHRIHSEHK